MEKYILRLGHNDRDFEEMIEKQGTVYKIKDKRTIDIHITTKETILAPDAMALWHSDGTAKGTTVPAGTMVMNNNIVVNQAIPVNTPLRKNSNKVIELYISIN